MKRAYLDTRATNEIVARMYTILPETATAEKNRSEASQPSKVA